MCVPFLVGSLSSTLFLSLSLSISSAACCTCVLSIIYSLLLFHLHDCSFGFSSLLFLFSLFSFFFLCFFVLGDFISRPRRLYLCDEDSYSGDTLRGRRSGRCGSRSLRLASVLYSVQRHYERRRNRARHSHPECSYSSRRRRIDCADDPRGRRRRACASRDGMENAKSLACCD